MMFLGLMVSVARAADVDAVSRALDVYTSDYYASPAVPVPSQASVAPAAPAPVAAAAGPKRHEFGVGTEHYLYKYAERLDDGSKFMSDKGNFNGVFASYTFRPFDVDSMYNELAHMLLRTEVRYASGRVRYVGSNEFSGIKDYSYELRGLIGKDYQVAPLLKMTPYSGLGWRYLNDGLDANQPGGYGRESKYFYAPLGVNIERSLPGRWLVGFNAEYDWLINGLQRSHLEDVDPGYETLNNKQRHGFGWRASLKVVKELPRMSLSFEPYYRFWHIDASDVQPIVWDGLVVGGGQEPDNTTSEVGLRLGAQF